MKPESTPRALSALGNGIGNGEHFMHMYPNSYVQSNDNIPISSFYFQDRVSTHISTMRKTDKGESITYLFTAENESWTARYQQNVSQVVL